MKTILLTTYVLMWPVIVTGVLFVISRGFLGEWRKARKKGHDLI